MFIEAVFFIIAAVTSLSDNSSISHLNVGLLLFGILVLGMRFFLYNLEILHLVF